MKGIALAAAVLVSALSASAARAEWPDHAIRWVVPFGPGGANDLIARVAAEAASKKLGQPVLIENRPGATVGTQAVARAAADGYTFLIGAAGVITNSLLLKNLPYQDSDLVPVGMIAVAPSVIVVNPNVPASNMAEFVAWAKTQGDAGITWSTAGSGSTPHFVAEMFKEATGVNVTIVPYRSGNDGVNAVLSNSASVTSEASIVVLPQIKAGLLKAIATTYEKRMSAYPSLMTTAEQGFPAVQIGHWAGLLASRGTPEPIIARECSPSRGQQRRGARQASRERHRDRGRFGRRFRSFHCSGTPAPGRAGSQGQDERRAVNSAS
jgi:tripartite-type tricarboxylate transporter receptor subunit TctC